MKRGILLIMALLILANEPVFAEENSRVQRLMLRRDARRRVREERIERMLSLRTHRKAARIANKRGTLLSPPTPSTRTAKRRAKIQSFQSRRTLAEQRRERQQHALEKLKAQREAKQQIPPEDLLPNQNYIPTLPLPTLDGTNHVLLLGQRSPMIASVNVTPDNEPVEVRSIEITMSSAVDSIASFEVFDDVGYVLGSATVDLAASSNGDVYTLDLSPAKAYFIAKDDTAIIAIRPRLRSINQGGTSGQTAQVANISVTAIGRWSSRQTLLSPSGPAFQKHNTALAVITNITNGGREQGVFTVGTQKLIGEFIFTARDTGDNEADPALSAVSFSVNAPGSVTLSNVIIRGDGATTESSCTYNAPNLTCGSIPEEIGSLQSPRTLSVYGDVSTTGTHPNQYLQLTINQPGTPDTAGAITWSDGETTFTWVEFDPPIVNGTIWR